MFSSDIFIKVVIILYTSKEMRSWCSQIRIKIEDWRSWNAGDLSEEDWTRLNNTM